jgi:3-deoxy-7-phosphoheptulonate synthase
MASGLSCAVGFKNGTDGSLDVAINALQSVAQPHRFLGISTDGQVSVVHTRGNAFAHIVLRGGANGPNYDAANIDECERRLNSGGLNSSIMVDCSHANSNKDYRNQPVVLESVAKQIAGGNNAITGVMIESHLHSGNQSIGNGADLAYGVSITDACVGWAETETMLRGLHSQLSVRFR